MADDNLGQLRFEVRIASISWRSTSPAWRRPQGVLCGVLVAFVALVSIGCRTGGITPVRTAFNRGVYHHSRGNLQAAVDEYRNAVAEDPEDHRARFNLGSALEAMALRCESRGDRAQAETLWGEAGDVYREILVERPEDVRVSINLAAREYEAGDRERAFTRLEEVIEKHPGMAAPRIALASHRFREARKQGQSESVRAQSLAEAQRLLEEAMKYDRSRADGNMLLGCVLVEQAKDQLSQGVSKSNAKELSKAKELFEKARELYQRGLRREPTDLATWLALAELEIAAGQPEIAVTWWKRVVALDPRHWKGHWRLAVALEGLGDLEGATRHLWAARSLDGESRHRTSAEYRDRLLRLYGDLMEREQSR